MYFSIFKMRVYQGEKGRKIQFTFSKRKTTQLNNKHKPRGGMYTV